MVSFQSVRLPSLLVALVMLLALTSPVLSGNGGRAVASPGGATQGVEPRVPPKVPGVDLQERERPRQGYTPRTGVKTNDPRRPSKRRILSHIIRSIKSTRHGELIRVFSWNIASPNFVRALIYANKRGVSVRVLMSHNKAMEQARDGDYWRLKRALRHRSRTHPQRLGQRSWAHTCSRSCRGRRGIAHSKFFVFSKAGGARRVVMSTSANATEVSVNSQWNDLYTNVGSDKIYRAYLNIFAESARDKPVGGGGYRAVTAGSISAYFYPWSGRKARGDRVLKELRRIKCRGILDGTGIAKRTRIRIAQDAIIDQRGITIAHKLRSLHENGCNIKIAYGLMGKEVRRILLHTNRGRVPMRQIVSDFDGDGVYDRYLHSKSMAVNGHYGKDLRARVAWQGSENWSGLAKISDEQGFKIRRDGAEKKYAAFVEYLFKNPPERSRASIAAARAAGIDPYAQMREELGIAPSTPIS